MQKLKAKYHLSLVALDTFHVSIADLHLVESYLNLTPHQKLLNKNDDKNVSVQVLEFSKLRRQQDGIL